MYQALNGNELVWVRCALRDDNHSRFGMARTTMNDGTGIVPNIAPRGAPNVADHCFNPV